VLSQNVLLFVYRRRFKMKSRICLSDTNLLILFDDRLLVITKISSKYPVGTPTVFEKEGRIKIRELIPRFSPEFSHPDISRVTPKLNWMIGYMGITGNFVIAPRDIDLSERGDDSS
jgi:hypothetical protein